MPTTLHIDILEGDYVETTDGRKMTRVAIVEGLEGTATKRLKDALDASGVPNVGDTHPTITGMRVIEKRAKDAGDTVVRITLTYSSKAVVVPGGDPGDPTIPVYEVGGIAQQEMTNVHFDGTPIRLGRPGGRTKPMGARTGIVFPSVTGVVRRIERGINPQAIAKAYVGKVNLTKWQDEDPGWWLCMSVGARTEDNGATWSMEYSFVLAPHDIFYKRKSDGAVFHKSIAWNPVVVATDESGFPIEDVTASDPPVDTDTIREILWFQKADFNALNI